MYKDEHEVCRVLMVKAQDIEPQRATPEETESGEERGFVVWHRQW